VKCFLLVHLPVAEQQQIERRMSSVFIISSWAEMLNAVFGETVEGASSSRKDNVLTPWSLPKPTPMKGTPASAKAVSARPLSALSFAIRP
jgi:hypothetical protein